MRRARVRVVLFPGKSAIFDLNTGIEHTIAELPAWMDESIAMLNMVEEGMEVPGIGVKVPVTNHNPIYYLTIRGELPDEN